MKPFLYFTRRLYSQSGSSIIILNLIGITAISLLEGAGIFLIIPLLGVTGIMNAHSNGSPFISWLLEIFEGIPEALSLSFILCLYVFINIGQGLIHRSQLILNNKLHQRFIRHLREETYKNLLQVNWGFFLESRKSDLVKVMTSEIARVKSGTKLFIQFLTSLVFAIIQIGIAFWISLKMTFFVVLFGLVLLFFSRHFIKKSKTFGKDNHDLSKTYLAGITDHFNGMKEIKSNTLEETHVRWFSSLCEKIENNSNEFIKMKTTSQFIYKAASSILIALFVYFSIRMLQSEAAQLMLIVIIFSRLWPMFTTIQSNLEKLASKLPSFEALIRLQDQCLEDKELMDKDFQNIKPLHIKQRIECHHVYFSYNRNGSSYALKNINVIIPSNRMTAIVGPSGAGKSTLIAVLMGLMKPEKGKVIIDGNELSSDYLLSFRRSIGYVPQDPFLFNASIKENLLLVEPDATEEQLWEALEQSSASEFVKNFPEGLDTLIGEKGIRLSGGERQRIVIARALLRKPSILVLDEATSALDSENEAKIKEALNRLKGKTTIIVIAHRLSTIRHAEQVIVLDNGEVIQKGEFNKLAYEQGNVFNSLLEKQMQVLEK